MVVLQSFWWPVLGLYCSPGKVFFAEDRVPPEPPKPQFVAVGHVHYIICHFQEEFRSVIFCKCPASSCRLLACFVMRSGSGPSTVFPCLSWTQWAKAEHNIPGASSPVLSEKGNNFPRSADQAACYVAQYAACLILTTSVKVHYGLILSLAVIVNPFSASWMELPLGQSLLSLDQCVGLVHPRCTPFFFPLLNFMRFLLAWSSNFPRPLWFEALHFTMSDTPSNLISSVLLPRVSSVWPALFMRLLNKMGLRTGL